MEFYHYFLSKILLQSCIVSLFSTYLHLFSTYYIVYILAIKSFGGLHFTFNLHFNYLTFVAGLKYDPNLH